MSCRMACSGSATTGCSAIATARRTWPVAGNCWRYPSRFLSQRWTIVSAAGNSAGRTRYDVPNARPAKWCALPSSFAWPARSKYGIAHESGWVRRLFVLRFPRQHGSRQVCLSLPSLHNNLSPQRQTSLFTPLLEAKTERFATNSSQVTHKIVCPGPPTRYSYPFKTHSLRPAPAA